MAYFITPRYSVALNTKVGSSSLSLAIIKKFHIDIWKKISTASYPPGVGVDDLRWHSRCPREFIPTKPVVLPIRDQIERFLSACAQIRQNDMNQILSSLENGFLIPRGKRPLNVQKNEHFTHQHMLQHNETHLFKFPDHLDELANFVELDLPLPVINEAGLRPKLTLLNSQLIRVQNYYAKDIELFDSIKSANTIVNVDPEVLKPAPKEPVPFEISPVQFRFWLINNNISMEMVEVAISSITDKAEREKVQVKWEFSLKIYRDDPSINLLTSSLGLSSFQVDQAFREAVLIKD